MQFRPSGLTATVEFGLESCRISKLGFSAATSQTLTAGSEAPAEIRSGLSGLKAKLGTGVGVRLNGWTLLSGGRVVKGDPVSLADGQQSGRPG